jgi:hypothetical protein
MIYFLCKNSGMKKIALLLMVFAVINCGSKFYFNHPDLDIDGKATIIILRPSMEIGSMIAVPILLNGQLVAKMRVGTYCELCLNAGQFEVQVGEGDPVHTLLLPQSLAVPVDSGLTVYLELVPSMAFQEGATFLALKPILVDEQTGLQSISQLKKIGM